MALMNKELVKDFVSATMEVDSLRVLQQMVGERLNMLEGGQPFHARPMIQSGEDTPNAGPHMARKQALATADKGAETKTPNKRQRMEK